MTDRPRRSFVCKPETDKSGLFRTFEHGLISGKVPSSIEYSKELAEFLKNGIELTTLEGDGLVYTSKWYLSSAIVGADGTVKEFLLKQNADENVQLVESMPPLKIRGSYYVRFEREVGWVARRRCVYLRQLSADEEILERNYVKMYRELEVKPYSRYFDNRIYELFDY
ncbi:hypothetical protein HY312_01220 [Candidatus Saccharibacteria bacterium]|nr:hypothetical protein [Candidatus Saccharibacteria bacterium]